MSISNYAGPLDRYAEIDDEVDVEQCSDSEAVTRRNIEKRRETPQTSLASPPCASDDERLTPEQISVHFHFALHISIIIVVGRDPFNNNNIFSNFTMQTKSRLVDSYNCDDMAPVQCHLETKELWDKFHDLGTEMIITKCGR